MDRTTITFSLPISLKKEIERFILAKSLEDGEKESVSYFCFKGVKCYLQAQKIENFEGLKKIWSEVFICNTNINLSKKLEILKKFKKEIEAEVEELESYFRFKELNKIDEVEVERFERMGQIPLLVREKMKK